MVKDKTIQKLRALGLCALVVFCFGSAGEVCGAFFEKTETAFGHRMPDNKPEDIQKVLKRISKASPDTGPENSADMPLAVMVVKGNPRAVVAIDLTSGKPVWRIDGAVSSEVHVGGNLAIFKSGQSVVAHNLKTGKKEWDFDLDEGWDFFGSDVFGDLVAISVGVGGLEPGGYANGKLMVLKASSGFKMWERGVGSGLLGEPVVIGDLVFAPWERQKIVVLDGYEGVEICRIRATDFAIHFLKRSSSNTLYYGSLSSPVTVSSIFRFGKASANGTGEGSTVYTPKISPVPGKPHFGRDGFARGIGGRSTEEKIKFHFEPAPSPDGAIKFADDKFYLHYWEYIIAFDAATSKVVWTYRSPITMESVDALGSGGLIAVDTQGDIFHIDGKTGRETWRTQTGETVYASAFDAEGFTPGTAEGGAPDPVEGLKKLIMDKDSRLLPIRSYATLLLADIPKPEITQELLEIFSDPTTPKMLRDTVIQAIEKRQVGAEYLVEALKMRYNYLEQTQSPPMSIVAPALINMEERDAVPALLDHLMNHETRIDDLTDIISAIHKLGDASVVDPLVEFVTLYHADSSFLKHEQVLASAAYTILKYGEKEKAESFIAGIRDGEQTLVELKKLLRAVLDPEIVAKEKAELKEKEDENKRKAAEAAAKAKEAARVPQSLTRDEINKAIYDNQELFAPCIRAALRKKPTLGQIRMRFLLTGSTGIASEVRILPNNIPGLNECISEAFSKIQFRKFKNHRQTATYTISIKSAAAEE